IDSTMALSAVFGRPAEWSRAAAAFLAEIAVAAPLSNPGKLGAIRIGRALAIARPPLGVSPADDRAEILAHEIALGILQGFKVYDAQSEYLDAIAPRFADAASHGITPDTRFALARAMAAAGACCPADTDPIRILMPGGNLRRGPRIPPDTAMALF